MEYRDCYTLEFMGGPYDGYTQVVSIPQENLLAMVSLPVNRNVLQVIQGDPPGAESPTRTVAMYELHEAPFGWRYQFLMTRKAGDLDWDQWCTKVCQAWKKFHQETGAGQDQTERER